MCGGGWGEDGLGWWVLVVGCGRMGVRLGCVVGVHGDGKVEYDVVLEGGFGVWGVGGWNACVGWVDGESRGLGTAGGVVDERCIEMGMCMWGGYCVSEERVGVEAGYHALVALRVDGAFSCGGVYWWGRVVSGGWQGSGRAWNCGLSEWCGVVGVEFCLGVVGVWRSGG
ncbi:hypothetical protein Tco_0012664 [Tanacetum coccineum]